MKVEHIIWPCDLSSSTRNSLVRSSRTRNFKPGEFFTMGSEVAESGLCYLFHGHMEIRINELQKSSPFAIYKGGDWLGGTTLHWHSDFLYRITAIEDSELVFFSDGILREIAMHDPEVYKLLYYAIAQYTNSSIDLLFASMSIELPQKIAYFLLKISQRFSRVAGATPAIPMSQGALAELLGLSRITLNHYLKVFEHEGIVNVRRNKIYVINSDALRKIAGIPVRDIAGQR